MEGLKRSRSNFDLNSLNDPQESNKSISSESSKRSRALLDLNSEVPDPDLSLELERKAAEEFSRSLLNFSSDSENLSSSEGADQRVWGNLMIFEEDSSKLQFDLNVDLAKLQPFKESDQKGAVELNVDLGNPISMEHDPELIEAKQHDGTSRAITDEKDWKGKGLENPNSSEVLDSKVADDSKMETSTAHDEDMRGTRWPSLDLDLDLGIDLDILKDDPSCSKVLDIDASEDI